MRIGELARRAGVTTRAVRYYEQLGLVSSNRLHNGYRDYEDAAVLRVRNINRLLGTGLSSHEVRELRACLDADLDGEPACAGLVELYQRRLDGLQARMDTLREHSDGLRAQIERLRSDS
ncbi:MerR family transcriptional regulator [Pseudonocardia acaciae]|uniref:MerR family transcriptional regulator n=1 Tax=Pseudonocardia acaciae TaxID=551276 RepID=UPI0005676E2C|nr:MerR family transcriptional regulator [Pseudonocardia acaciae]